MLRLFLRFSIQAAFRQLFRHIFAAITPLRFGFQLIASSFLSLPDYASKYFFIAYYLLFSPYFQPIDYFH